MNETVEVKEAEGELRAPVLTEPKSAIAHIPGTITQQIGSGEYAQTSIVYRTILWSFIAGGVFSVAAIGISVWRGTDTFLTNIKDIWSVFVPLITLALGYLFGKGR